VDGVLGTIHAQRAGEREEADKPRHHAYLVRDGGVDLSPAGRTLHAAGFKANWNVHVASGFVEIEMDERKVTSLNYQKT